MKLGSLAMVIGNVHVSTSPFVHKHRTKTTGVRRWFLRSELEKKFGADVATDIINRKLSDEKLKKSETRMFQDLPDREDQK